MSNVGKIKRPPVLVSLDKDRQLKYTLNSFSMMEERYGSVDEALEVMEGGSVRAVRFMLWAGLIHEDKSLTEEMVGDMIELTDMEEIAQKMNEVMSVDLPDKSAATNPNA